VSRLFPVLVCVMLVAAGCGAPGDPLPPSLNIPERITDLAARQQGDRLLVSFTLPALTTDGVALRRFRAVELRAGPAPEGNFDIERWLAQAAAFPVPNLQPGPVALELPASDWVGRELILAVRTAGPKGRFSDWSNLVALPIQPPLERPTELQATATAEGVKLSWRTSGGRAGVRFRILRRGAQQQREEVIGESERPEFTDSTAGFGATWEYWVQAYAKAGEIEALSEPSERVSITPEDRFPPAPPQGLRAAASLGSVELAWDPSSEPDLRGYYVWRSTPGTQMTRISPLLELPGFSDRKIESGKKYLYAVSAVDTRGNESALSTPVEVIAP